MFNSIDALSAFVQAAELGSFSAAARHLGKSQSTISEAISNLEIDAGLTLFDRTQRQLTPAGVQLLIHARQVLNSHDALKRQASALHAGLEAQLSIVLSDTFQSREFELLLSQFAERFPLLRLECLADEDQDVLHLLRSGRAHLGLIRAQANYGADFSALPIPGQREMAIYVSQQHPLAQIAQPTVAMLAEHRELALSSYTQDSNAQYSPRCWLAPSYLMLLEMTLRSFGWAALPTWQVENFGHGQLVQLKLPNWPRSVQVDVIWSRHAKLGPACSWLIDHISQTLKP